MVITDDIISKAGNNIIYIKDSCTKTIASNVNAQLFSACLAMVEKNKINIVEEEIIKSAKNISHRKLSKYIHKVLIEIQDVKAIISAWRHGNITNYDE